MTEPSTTIAAVVCDLDVSPIGTRSRLAAPLAGTAVLTRTLASLSKVTPIDRIILLAPEAQIPALHALVGRGDQFDIVPLTPRSDRITTRVRAARAWNLRAWRGGAGQWTVFDEDFHPQALAALLTQYQAAHLLCIPAHAPFLDAPLTSALLHHHLHKNHEMRLTYTPAAPGLSGIALRADLVHEMAEKSVLPGQLLGYDPRTPTFDTLIREACMQVDPALSKIPNRFLVDTDRSFALAEKLLAQTYSCPADLALAARELSDRALLGCHASTAAAGEACEQDSRLTLASSPHELELELTARRLISPPGSLPAAIRESRPDLPASAWISFFSRQSFADDLLLTIAGDGDPLLYPALSEVLAAARAAGVRNIHVQTDLVSDLAPLLPALKAGHIDILSVNFIADDAATYAELTGAYLHSTFLKNLETLSAAVDRGGLPLIVPRLLKVRQTIPQMEAFFDRWVLNAAWAVFDAPTDRAGSIPFAAVVDMAPPKRRPCRRLAERLLLRADGSASPCDQDIRSQLSFGSLSTHNLPQLWLSPQLTTLRTAHTALGQLETGHRTLDTLPAPCTTCKEWHRP